LGSHIKNLRKNISGPSPESELIHSVYGLGYKFDEQQDSRKDISE
jgi:DNA-binding response OmpR family regulator